MSFVYRIPHLKGGRDARCDSSNATWSHRIAMLKEIEICMGDPSILGIVIPYGTDTEELFGNTVNLAGNSAISKPIVSCGSIYPEDSPVYDFPRNLTAATIFAAYSEVAGVFHMRPGINSSDRPHVRMIFHDFGKHGGQWHERVWDPEKLRDPIARVYYEIIGIENLKELICFQRPTSDSYTDYPDHFPLSPTGVGRPGRVLGYKRPRHLSTRRDELEGYKFVNKLLADYLTWRNLRIGNKKESQRAEYEWTQMVEYYGIPESVVNLLSRVWDAWGLRIDPTINYFPRFDYRFTGQGIFVVDALTDPLIIRSLIESQSPEVKMCIIEGTGAGHARTLDDEAYLPFIDSCRTHGIPVTVLAGTPGESASIRYAIAYEMMRHGVWFPGTRSRFSATAIASYMFHPDHQRLVEELDGQFSVPKDDINHQVWCSDLVFPLGNDRQTYTNFYPHIETRVGMLGGMPFVEAALISAMALSWKMKGKIPDIQQIDFPLPE
jgi:hypothetical protein